MTKQEKLAREWAEGIIEQSKGTALWGHDGCLAAAELVLAHTKPPTMADVEWDAREHRGMVGVGEDGVEWVMIDMRTDMRIIGVSPDFRKVRGLRPEWLTPNGKRYELREVTVSSGEKVGADQPEHPQVLRTVEDYENAPKGTIVAIQGFHTVWVKNEFKWCNGRNDTRPSTSMAEIDRQLLRWGWGE